MDVLFQGEAEIHFMHPDDFREWVRTHKKREAVEKLMTEREAVSRLVSDGDYITYDFSSLTRGPQALVREIIRQRRQDLWVCAEFTLHETPLLVGAGCASRIDVGFLGYGNYIGRAVTEGKVRVFEWTNGALSFRMLAGAMGVPFVPIRSLIATDTMKYSGAKVVRDPFTGDPVCLVPALHPDVFLVHVHQADVYGNSRIFGTNLFALEAAMASKRVIVSAEEIIDHLEFRKEPSKTTIPYFLVDALVHMPFGAYPGGVHGRYELDLEHIDRLNAIQTDEEMRVYLEEYIYSLESHEEFLEKKVGWKRLKELIRKASIKEGYH
ncbi:MAG: CoA transferase subunit A [candidate division NC10 bacterium]|nr:CoA transferase subunit A [candidate division NC10 bacterium]